MAPAHESGLVGIVDDDELVREAVQGLLRGAGLAARAFASAEQFLRSGAQHSCSCLITDVRMPGMSGLALQARLQAEQIRIPIIFITAHADEQTRTQAARSGAVTLLAKPFDDDVLLGAVRAALETRPGRA